MSNPLPTTAGSCALLTLGVLVVLTAPAGGASAGTTRLVIFLGLALMGSAVVLWLRAAGRASRLPEARDRGGTSDPYPQDEEGTPHGAELVTVFEPVGPAALASAEAALRAAQIPFVTQHAGIQDLVGAGQLGGYNPAVGSPAIQVARHDVDLAIDALGLLSAATDPAPQHRHAWLGPVILLTPFALVLVAAVSGLLVPPAWRWPAGLALVVLTTAVGFVLRAAGRRGEQPP
jgi:hypothetical protein